MRLVSVHLGQGAPSLRTGRSASMVSQSPVVGVDLVRDRNMGVQVGVAGAGIAMVEPGRDHALHRHVPGTLVAGPGEQHPRLGVGERVGHRRVMRGPDRCRQRPWGERPQGRHRLGWGEGGVEPGHRHPRMGAGFRDEPVQLPRTLRRHAVLGGEPLPAHVGPHLAAHRLGPHGRRRGVLPGLQPASRVRPRTGSARCRTPSSARPSFSPVVGFRPAPNSSFICSSPTRSPGRQADPGQAGTPPGAGRLAFGGVVVGQGGVATPGRVQGRDLPGQVLIARPGRQLLQPDRHRFTSLDHRRVLLTSLSRPRRPYSDTRQAKKNLKLPPGGARLRL